MADDDAPKIQIDSDWKEQAQAEKQRLAEQAKAAASPEPSAEGADPGAGGAHGEMPPANFETLLGTFVTQALFSLGAVPDPATGRRVANLDLARHSIDMLSVVEDKTKGNLTDEESSALAGALYELRMRYVQVANSVRSTNV